MVRQKSKTFTAKDLIKSYIVVNESVWIDRGRIYNNPFYQNVKLSQASQWMVQHKNLFVNDSHTGKIQQILNQKGMHRYGVDADDCFEFGLFYFMSGPNKTFKKNFHGDNTDYSIKNYLLGRNLEFMVRAYLNKVEELNSLLDPFIDAQNGEKEDGNTQQTGVVASRTVLENSLDIDEDILLSKDIEYGNNLYIEVVQKFTKFLKISKYNISANNLNLFNDMFLNLDTSDILEHFSNLREKYNISEALLKVMMDDLQEVDKDIVGDFYHISSEIRELMELRDKGWDIPTIDKKYSYDIKPLGAE